MSTATIDRPPTNAVATTKQEHAIEFVPLGEREAIKLTHTIVLANCVSPTKSGSMPTNRDVTNFIMLCKARALNPFVGDAFLVGYDSEGEGPKFSLITAHQALLKRAEAEPQFDGMQGGVIVVDADKKVVQRNGAMRLPGDLLHGAWATVYRKDRSHPTETTVEFGPYNTGRSRWRKDPAGMIVKVAKDAALREAFPSTLGGMYGEEEMDAVRQRAADAPEPKVGIAHSSKLGALADRLSQTLGDAPTVAEPPDESYQAPAESDEEREYVGEESEAMDA